MQSKLLLTNKGSAFSQTIVIAVIAVLTVCTISVQLKVEESSRKNRTKHLKKQQ